MNLDRLNQWLSLLANVGVIAGFLLLAVQMQQNTNAIRLQNNYALGSGIAATELAMLGDTGYATNAAAILRPSELSDEQIYQLFLYIDSVMNTAWNTWVAFQAGNASVDAWNAARATVGGLFTFDAARAIWNRYKSSYPDEFVAEIDGELAHGRADMLRDFRGMVDDVRKLQGDGSSREP